jgi:hypothetical protein
MNLRQSSAKKHDWLTIEQDYVTSLGKSSLRRREQKYGCTHSAIHRHADKEAWLKKCEEHRAKLSTKAVQHIG